jgi:GT2 family glycosyltransferase
VGLSVSVVIPSLNSLMIDQVLAALRTQNTPPDEILVVGLDRAGLVKEDAQVRLISTGRPVSPAQARNLGARSAHGDVICYIDADCIAAPDWTRQLLAHHARGAEIVGGSILVERTHYWQYCDNLAAFAPFLSVSPPGPRPYLPSLNLSIRRALLMKFGGFDERFTFASGEDTDLCFRLRRAGYTLWFEPQAVVVHRHMRASPGDLWRHLYMYGKVYAEIYPHYPDLLGVWRRMRASIAFPGALRLLGPALAALDCVERLIRWPYLWRYLDATPALLLASLAWYHGAATTLQMQQHTNVVGKV